MPGKLLSIVALALVIVGCARRNDGASSAEGDPTLAPAKRWQQDPPRKDPPQDVQEVADRHTANRGGEPTDDGARSWQEILPANRAASGPPKPTASNAAKQTESPGGETEATTADQPPGVITLRTDDCDVWPSYDWPLEIHVDVPEVPERITEPAPPIEDD